MNPLLKTIRALAVEFIKRIYIPLSVVGILVVALLTGFSLWLTTASEWWWILAIFMVGFLILLVLAVLCSSAILRIVAPEQTKEQKKLTKLIVDKMQTLAEITSTPRFVLLFHISRDVISPRDDGFISSLSQDTTTLKKEFEELRDSFNS